MHFIILGSAPDLLFYMHGTCSRLDILNINNYKIMYIYLTGNQIWVRYVPSQATLLRPLLRWVRYVPPWTASHRQLATAARVDNSPLLTTSALVSSCRQLTAAAASALIVNGSDHRC